MGPCSSNNYKLNPLCNAEINWKYRFVISPSADQVVSYSEIDQMRGRRVFAIEPGAIYYVCFSQWLKALNLTNYFICLYLSVSNKYIIIESK